MAVPSRLVALPLAAMLARPPIAALRALIEHSAGGVAMTLHELGSRV